MINFKAGAWRPANDDVRITAANELVQRTLGENGLMPNFINPSSGLSTQTLPGTGYSLPGLNSALGKASTKPVLIPDGAEFRQNLFSCAAGDRNYRTYVPSNAMSGIKGVVVMLHGCTQTPEDFAIGTGMNALAEEHGFVVVYPQQSRGDNAQSCWNWFSRGDQQRDQGEPAILAGMTKQVIAEHNVMGSRTFVAGLSAGAAMAIILGETYPDIFCGVGAHSGLPFGSAKDVPSAFTAMAGTVSDMRFTARNSAAVPTIIFQGIADATVHPSNGDRIAQNVKDQSPPGTTDVHEQGLISGRSFERRILRTSGGSTLMEHWTINGLGHAWSGGQPGGSCTEPNGPDASAEIIRFFFETDSNAI